MYIYIYVYICIYINIIHTHIHTKHYTCIGHEFSEVNDLPDEEMIEIFSPTGEDSDTTCSIVAHGNQLPVPITDRRKTPPEFLLTAPDLEQRDPK